jgi:uncharacterized membrane protein YphA (DoxX/SURF4 family)
MPLALLLGLYARVAAAVLAVHVFLALVTTGSRKGFTRLPDASWEYELVLLAGLLAVALGGPVPFAVLP